MDPEDHSSYPVLMANLMDEDLMPGSDDDLGYCYIWSSETSHAFNSLEKIRPSWRQLHLPKSSKPQGQLLVSFYFIEVSKANEFDFRSIDIRPETKLYTFEIFCLGLRNLKPKGLMPVKKTFINFDLNSLNQGGNEGGGSFLKNVKTQPKEKGTNPNMTAIIKFDVALPVDKIYMPDLQVGVFDLILAGLSDTMLGLFVIPIHERMEISKKWKKKFDHVLQQLLENQDKEEISMITSDGEEDDDIVIHAKDSSDHPLHETKAEPINAEEVEISDKNKEEEKPEQMEDIEKPSPAIKKSKTKRKKILKGDQVVAYPVYTFIETPKKGGAEGETKKIKIEDEDNKPDPEVYTEIGWNRKNQEPTKHYRKYFRTPLEEVKDFNIRSPFDVYYVNRGEFKDESEEAGIFEALRNVDAKILKRYNLSSKEEVARRSSLTMVESSASENKVKV